jgi:hypothetical protein
MIFFVETIKFDLAFAKAVYNAFYDSEKRILDFNGRRYRCKTKWKGWPDGLDMENFELVQVGKDFLVFESGGDWQEMIPVALCLGRDSHGLVWSPFDSYVRDNRAKIKLGLQDLVKCVQSFAEDCQIAGPML